MVLLDLLVRFSHIFYQQNVSGTTFTTHNCMVGSWKFFFLETKPHLTTGSLEVAGFLNRFGSPLVVPERAGKTKKGVECTAIALDLIGLLNMIFVCTCTFCCFKRSS